MNVLVAGAGKSLAFLCTEFLAKGHRVTVIDRDAAECARLARRLKAVVVHGDASNPVTLEEAGATEADALLAATPHDADNLVICQLARIRFGVPRVLALVHDPENETLFSKLGVDAFSTTRILASLIEQRTALADVTNLIPAGEGKVRILELALTEASPVLDRPLAELELPPDCLVAVVTRDGRPLIPRGSTRLAAGDRVLLVTLPESHGPALRALAGGGS